MVLSAILCSAFGASLSIAETQRRAQLSNRVRVIFEAAERGETFLAFSAITLAEMYYSDKKFQHFEDFEAVYKALASNSAFLFLPFHPEDVLDFEQDSHVPGMHDRIITGLARRLDVPLIASDPEIVNANLVETIW